MGVVPAGMALGKNDTWGKMSEELVRIEESAARLRTYFNMVIEEKYELEKKVKYLQTQLAMQSKN